jgi:hypothetical protein
MAAAPPPVGFFVRASSSQAALALAPTSAAPDALDRDEDELDGGTDIDEDLPAD